MSESNLPSAVTRLWTEPGLRKRADVMFNLLADVERNNVSNLVSQLATLNEFWLIMRLLDAVDYGAPATAATTSRPEVHAKIRNLARLGEAVLNVDTHDFESWCQDDQIPQHIRDDLALRTWPLKMQDEATGALHSLIPTFELLLEVFETRILKGDISMGLSIIHLMTEYLPENELEILLQSIEQISSDQIADFYKTCVRQNVTHLFWFWFLQIYLLLTKKQITVLYS